MSLLLTFFVLLLSFATITEEEAFHEAIASFRGSVGFLPRELTMIQVNPVPKKMRPPKKPLEDAARKMRRALQVLGEEQRIKVEYDARGGLRINLPSQVLFDTGSGTLKPESFQVLAGLGRVLSTLPEGSLLDVRGYTDNVPLADVSVYRDNHDLSVARADSVARFLSDSSNIPFGKFEITGTGAGQPIAPNNTSEGRQANRRVEIHVRGAFTGDMVDQIESRVQGLTNPPPGGQI